MVEGHRIFESEEVMDLSKSVVAITGKPATLRDRAVPTPESSLSAYQTRIRPHLPGINSSKYILKLDAQTSAGSMVKKIATYIIMKDLGLPEAGRYLSDIKTLLETDADP